MFYVKSQLDESTTLVLCQPEREKKKDVRKDFSNLFLKLHTFSTNL